MSAIRGSVQMPVPGIEILARQSSNIRRNSEFSTIEELREHERLSVNDKQWSLKLLKSQFKQKNLENLYRRYDNNLRLGYLSMFILILLSLSIVHMILVASMGKTDTNKIIAVSCYVCQAILPIPFIAILFIEKIVKKHLWIRLTFSVIILSIMVITDILVSILSNDTFPLRPAYYTNALLACYIFLPIYSNWIALLLGTIISIGYLAVLWFVTYNNNPTVYREIGGDILYFFGVNFIGLYYRLMKEIVSRRSFLDRRAYLEGNLKLAFEKEQEEKLLISILPEHVISIVRTDLRNVYKKINDKTGKYESALLQDISPSYINEYENVSILYADVVNYTTMTTKLAPNMLIETLNELFGRFDEASEEHDVLRIKFLGDCYYCVSGMPKPNPQHAKSCIDLGLDMISIIKDVRESRDLTINMRIGIHSGKVSSGLIGIIKWQYDIWSKDVTIANKMESTGKSGKVHITNKTLEELGEWSRDYIIEPNYEARNEPFLKENNIVTFLVSNPNRQSEDYDNQRIQFRRVSVGLAKKMKKGVPRPKLSETNTRSRTTAFIDNNLVAYRRMLKAADSQMADVIENMPSGILFSEHTKEDSLNSQTLLFRNISWEMSFIKQPDPLFKYFLFANLCILILNMAITVVSIRQLAMNTLIIDAILAVTLIILQPLSWTQFFWIRYKGKEKPKNKIIKFFYKSSSFIVRNAITRCVIYIFVSCTLSISSLISMTECEWEVGNEINVTSWYWHHQLTTMNKIEVYNESCISSWHLAQACFLTLLMCFLFSRVLFLLKWTVGLILTGVYLWIVWDFRSEILETSTSWNANLNSKIAHTLAVVFLTYTLYWIDRQTEFRNRLDHKWKKQLKEKQEDASMTKLFNNMLLHNILPVHVAEIYLDMSRSPEELYCEQYQNVAVIFASLTDYKFVTDTDDPSEIFMLNFLNQLIIDFDKILLRDNNMKIEKIKMAGWTYMAACGLEPSKRFSLKSVDSDDDDDDDGEVSDSNDQYVNGVVYTMVKFAADMMEQLQNFNRYSFQNMNLRIGISHGMITAGVVGSSKPLYDIWGNAVNMASRMDSTGIAGKIQVTENTAIVLDRQGILTQYRGKTFVKGLKDYARTYFVPLDENYELIYKTNYIKNTIKKETKVTSPNKNKEFYYETSEKSIKDNAANDVNEVNTITITEF